MRVNSAEVSITFSVEHRSIAIAFSRGIHSDKGEERRFKVVDLDLDEVLANGTDSAAALLGRTILNLLDQVVDGGIGCADFAEQRDQMRGLIHDRAMLNDPDAQSHLAVCCLNDSVDKRDEALLDVAEEWFRKAADTGDEESKGFYDHTWPKMKESYRKEIRRRREKGRE